MADCFGWPCGLVLGCCRGEELIFASLEVKEIHAVQARGNGWVLTETQMTHQCLRGFVVALGGSVTHVLPHATRPVKSVVNRGWVAR